MKPSLATLLSALGLVVLTAGCQRNDPPGGGGPGESVPTRAFEVRLLGVNAGGYSSVLLDLRSLTATANKQPVGVTVTGGRVDLATAGHAWPVATLQVPETVEEVDLTLAFDDAGAYESPRGQGAIDARRVRVRWRAPVAAMLERGHTVVHLDVEDSLVARASWRRQLIPELSVHY